MLVLGFGGLDRRFLAGEAVMTNFGEPFLGGGPLRLAGDIAISMDLRGFFAAGGLDMAPAAGRRLFLEGGLDVAREARLLTVVFLPFVVAVVFVEAVMMLTRGSLRGGAWFVPAVNCDTVCHSVNVLCRKLVSWKNMI